MEGLRMGGCRRGFGLVDAVVSVVVLCALMAVVVVSGTRARSAGMQAGSVANLHEFAAVTSSYGADFQDHVWSFSWRTTDRNLSGYSDLNAQLASSTTPLQSASVQAIDIARRRGRPDAAYLANWVPSVTYGHWVLSEYLDQPLTLRFAVSPGDRYLRLWADDPTAFYAGQLPPTPPPQQQQPRYGPYGMSYRMGPAFWATDFEIAPTRGSIRQGHSHSTYQLSASHMPFRLGERRWAEVTYPSQKVFMFDSAQWTGARAPVWWGYLHARVPQLMADGSVQVRASGRSNVGFQPDLPASPFSTLINYSPSVWEPPLLGVVIKGRVYWTRNGIRGRDYDGPEVPATP
jgi:hypothetical protein